MKKKKIKILMLLEGSYPEDIRVRYETKALVEKGYRVSIIALRVKGEKLREYIDSISVFRIPRLELFKKGNSSQEYRLSNIVKKITSMVGYIGEYLYVTLGFFFLSLYVFLSEGFDIIHAHNPPDTFFTVGLFYKIIGKKFIFDHHDLSPELYLTRFGNRKGIIYYGLRLIEKLSLKSADVVIATNESFKRIDCKRGGIPLEKITVLRNGPDLSEIKRVNSCRELIHLNKSIIGYVGEMNPQDGLDYLLRAIKILVYDFGRSDFVCVLIGSGDSFEELKRYSKELKIDPYILFPGYIKKPKLLGYLSAADICVCPDPFNDLNDASTMIKIMEYMALSKPIVAFDLIETRFSAKDAALYVRCNDEIEFAKAIITLLDSKTLREQMGASGYQRVKNILAWSHVVNNLYIAYDSISVNQPKRYK